MALKPITENGNNMELHHRPLTGEEVKMYTFLKDHYSLRVAALPKVRFLKTYLKRIENIIASGVICTIDTAQI